MHIRFLSLVAALAVTAAACGSDDEAKPEATTAAPTTTVAATTTASEHDMDDMDHSDPEHDMDDMEHGEAVGVAKPLPVLADGTLDPDGVDLSGIEGVTSEQQAYAEDLLVRTITTLPKWADYDQAIADGYLSIGDGITGEEHVIRWDLIEDDVWLDPTQPESLVYRVERAADGTETKTLEAAMFLLPKKFNLSNAPADAGALMQYHIHDNLCFTDFPQPRVAGLRDHNGPCPEGLIAFDPNIMVHVWIRQNDCGPFAALKGVGGGQTLDDVPATCLADHGELGL